MDLPTVIALIISVISLSLVLFNTLHAWQKGRVQLKISASAELVFGDGTRMASSLKNVEDLFRDARRRGMVPRQEFFCVEVGNLSDFPITLSKSQLRSKSRKTFTAEYTERQYPLPCRLESREMYQRKYLVTDNLLMQWERGEFTKIYAETQCGREKTSSLSNFAILQLSTLLRASKCAPC